MKISRRNVLAASASAPVLAGLPASAAPQRILAVMEAGNPSVQSPPVTHALAKLRQALTEHNADLDVATGSVATPGAAFAVVVAAPGAALASDFPPGTAAGMVPEQFRIAPGKWSGLDALLVSAGDIRGFVYGLLELAEQVRFGGAAALQLKEEISDKPANRVRSVARAFCSEIEDKPWFYAHEFWQGYLDMLVACRFNRFNFSLGIAYDFPRGVTDDYFHFPYPYLVSIPG